MTASITQNNVYVHSSPPKAVSGQGAAIRQWVKYGDLEKLESVVLDGQGARLLGLMDTATDSKVKTFLRSVPGYMAKVDMIHEAVVRGSLKETQSLLDKRKLAIARDAAGRGLAHKAVYYNHKPILEWLVKKYPETIHLRDREGRTCLHYAGANKESGEELYSVLTKLGARQDTQDIHGKKAVHYLKNPTELDIDGTYNGNHSHNNYRSFSRSNRSFYNNGSNKISPRVSPLSSENKFVVHNSISGHLPEGNSPLGWASINQHNGASSNQNPITRAQIRIWIHERDIPKLEKIVWNGKGDKLLLETTKHGNVRKFLDSVPFLLDRVKSIHMAAIQNDTEAMKDLKSRTSLPEPFEGKDAYGLTALHKAAGLNNRDVVEYLMYEFPSTVNEVDHEGKTPLHYAAKDEGMYSFLVKMGADESVTDLRGKTASYYLNHPNELDPRNLRNIPDAPRVSGEIPEWDRGAAPIPKREFHKRKISNGEFSGEASGGEGSEGKGSASSKVKHRKTSDVYDEDFETEDFMNEDTGNKGTNDDTQTEEKENKPNLPVNAEAVKIGKYDLEGEEITFENLQVEPEMESIQQEETVEEQKLEDKLEERMDVDEGDGGKTEDRGFEKEETEKKDNEERPLPSEEGTTNGLHEQNETENGEKHDLPKSDGEKEGLMGDQEVDKNINDEDKSKQQKEPEMEASSFEKDREEGETGASQRQENPSSGGVVENGIASDEVDLKSTEVLEEAGQKEKEINDELTADQGNQEVNANVEMDDDPGGKAPNKEDETTTSAPEEEKDEKVDETPPQVAELQETISSGVEPDKSLTEDQNKPPVQNIQPSQEDITEDEPNVDDLIVKKDMEKLVDMVLVGRGGELIGKKSEQAEVQEFLSNVPAYMAKIASIHAAAGSGNLRDLQTLLDRKRLSQAKDLKGRTPLHHAVLHGHQNCARYLSHGYPQCISMVDNNGRTALHYAATLDDSGTLYKALIQNGADPNIKDSRGNTPGIYLRRKDLLPRAELLEEYIGSGKPPTPASRGKSSTKSLRKQSIETWQRPPTPAPIKEMETPAGPINGDSDVSSSKRLSVDMELTPQELELLETFYAQISKEGSIWSRTWRRLTSGTHDMEAKQNVRTFLTRPIFDLLKTRSTPRVQATLLDCIKFYPQFFIVAPDPQAYMTFKELFLPAIAKNNGFGSSRLPLIHPPLLMQGEIPIDEKFPVLDVPGKYISQVRIHLSRNLHPFPFIPVMTKEQLNQVHSFLLKILKTGLPRSGYGEWEFYELEELEKEAKHELSCNRGVVFPVATKLNRFWPHYRTLVISRDNQVIIWVGVEDHLEVIATSRYGKLKPLLEKLDKLNNEVFQSVRFHVNSMTGYLTVNPFNCGTAMKTIFRVRLPYTMKSRSDFTKICSQRCLSVTWSSRKGDKEEEIGPEEYVELENIQTVGLNENELVQRTANAVNEILKMEQEASRAADAAITKKK